MEYFLSLRLEAAAAAAALSLEWVINSKNISALRLVLLSFRNIKLPCILCGLYLCASLAHIQLHFLPHARGQQPKWSAADAERASRKSSRGISIELAYQRR
jgi:hypothetical protein